MLRVMGMLYRNRFDGVLIPDHSLQRICSASWLAGMAHAHGFMKADIMAIEHGFRPASNLIPTTSSLRK